MDLSGAALTHEQQAPENACNCIPSTPTKPVPTKRTVVSVLNSKGIPAFESLVDVPVALLDSLPEKPTSSTSRQAIISSFAPITPEKNKKAQHDKLQGVVHLVIEQLNNKGGLSEFVMSQVAPTSEQQDFCTDNNQYSSPLAPLTPFKDKAVQPCKNTDSVAERSINGMTQKNCMNKEAISEHPISLPQGLSPQCPENGREEDHDLHGIDLNKAPRKKTIRRKKHRPKVIREGNAIKYLSPQTPNIAEKKEKMIFTRTYVRRKKAQNSPGAPADKPEKNREILIPMKTYMRKRKAVKYPDIQSAKSAETATPCCPIATRTPSQYSCNVTKLVRRSLDFSAEGESINKCHVSTATDVAPTARRTLDDINVTADDINTYHSGVFRGELTEGIEVLPTMSAVEIALDLNRSLNQILDEYINLPENPVSLAQPNTGETTREQSNVFENIIDAEEQFRPDTQSDVNLIDAEIEISGTSRDRDHIGILQDFPAKKSLGDVCLVHETNQISLYQEASLVSPYFSRICKKRRSLSHKFSRCFAFADAQQSVASGPPLSQLLTLTFDSTRRVTRKRSKIPTRARKPICLVDYKEITRKSVEQGTSLPCYEMSCMDALCTDTRFNKITKKRRNKGHCHLVNSMLSSTKLKCEVASSKYAFPGQLSVQRSREPQWKDLSQLHVYSFQDSHIKRFDMQSFGSSFRPEAIIQHVDPVDLIVDKMKQLNICGSQIKPAAKAKGVLIPYFGAGMMVPFGSIFDTVKKQQPRAKVDLDPETNRVWNLLMGKKGDAREDGLDNDKEKWWEEERRIFHGRADAFIARMHLIQGDRRFSKWKGSVVDSVVGVFLTQNVTDHLSSSAFMSLVARFPLQSEGKSKEPNAERVNASENKGDGTITTFGGNIYLYKRSVLEAIDTGCIIPSKKEKRSK